MNKVKLWATVFLVICPISCNRVKSDARKAAKYTNESIEKSINLKLEESKKMYDKSQKIIEKYRSSKESDKFFEYYRRYRDEGKIQKEEQS